MSKVKMQTLVRERLAVSDKDKLELDSDIKELATKSRLMLGYKVLHDLITAPRTLKDILIELDIQPYSIRSVRTYQEKMKKIMQIQFAREARMGSPKKRADWIRTQLSYYKDCIPEFVLRKALQIKEAMPDVKLEVEHLGQADPFLVACAGEERYYIEVWDEPKFENKVLAGLHISSSDGDGDNDDASDGSSSAS